MVAVQPSLQIVERMFRCVTRDQIAPGVQWRSGNPELSYDRPMVRTHLARV